MALSEERQRAICDDYVRGASTIQLGDKYCRSASSIRYILVKNKIPMRPQGSRSKSLGTSLTILRLHDKEKLKFADISRRLRMSPAEVSRRYNAAKVNSMLPDTVACPTCGRTAIPNPDKQVPSDATD